MTEPKHRWAYCSKCETEGREDIFDYWELPGGDTTFPRGEFLAHRNYLVTGFKSEEEAVAWKTSHKDQG